MARRDYTHGGSNRGFKAPRRKGVVNPRVRKQEGTRGAVVATAVPIPHSNAIGKTAYTWPPPPAWWLHSVGEWIVYWYLTEKRKFKLDVDFYYQSHVYADTLFANVPFTQADFLIDLGADTKLGDWGGYTGLVLDPFVEFTHDYAFDLERARVLNDHGYALVYLEEGALELETEWLIEEALRPPGHDHSNRGTHLG